MSMLSVDQVEAIRAQQESERKERKNYINELSGLSNIGDQVQVQFVGIKGIADIVAQNCHIIHLVGTKLNKQGKPITYKKYVPCLKEEGTTNSCPLCDNPIKGKDYDGNDTDDTKTDLVTPLLMINLNKQFDPKQNQFVDSLKPTATDKGTQLKPIGAVLVKKMNTSKRFRDAFIKFVRENKDLTNKVITIEKIRFVKDGKPSNTGTHLDDDYAFSINTMIDPVNEADFTIPTIESLFDVFKEVDMDRYVNTGSFYEKKNKNNTENTAPVANNTAAPLPDESPAEETNYNSIPGTTFKRREE